MVRRSNLSARNFRYWFVLSLATAACGIFASLNSSCSAWYDSEVLGSTQCPSDTWGDLKIPLECCPCPYHGDCPNGWPEVPAHCRTGCEPGQPIECCECPTKDWCEVDWPQEHNFRPPSWCADAPWRDAGADASDSAPAMCPVGTCVPPTPEGWTGPVTFTTGWDMETPACPAGSTTIDGWHEPPPPSCPTCECSEPKSSCGLSTTWTLSSHDCSAFDSGVKTPINPPPNWNGSCSTQDSIAPDKLCGNEPCVAAIQVSAPVFERIDTSCKPISKVDDLPPVNVLGAGPQTSFGRVCVGSEKLEDTVYCGEGNTKVCKNIPDGSLACIMRDGDVECPAAWSKKDVFYRNVKDERSCSECSCGPIENAVCRVKYRIFADSLCSNDAEFGAYDIESSASPACYDLPVGSGILSKSMEKILHASGECQPTGGKVIGEVQAKGAFTVCCLSDDM